MRFKKKKQQSVPPRAATTQLESPPSIQICVLFSLLLLKTKQLFRNHRDAYLVTSQIVWMTILLQHSANTRDVATSSLLCTFCTEQFNICEHFWQTFAYLCILALSQGEKKWLHFFFFCFLIYEKTFQSYKFCR